MNLPNVLNQDKLRSLAEVQLKSISQLEAAAYDKDKLLCELQIHQIELELQNEELRRAQQELEETRDRYIDLYEFSPVAYLTITEQGIIQESNLTGATLLGVERQKLLQRRFAGFIDATDADRWHLFLSQALKQIERQTLDLTLKPADNHPLYAQLDCLPVLSADNQLLLRLGLTDITARKQAEIVMRQAQQLAEEAARAKSQFLANMSHEIRTPLSAILGFAQVLAQDNLTEKQHKKITHILTAGQDLLFLINGILDFSKIEAGKLTLDQHLFLLEEVFTHLTQLVEFRVREKNVELVFSTSAQIPPLLMGDAQRLSQILLNLVDNALKFSENGKVTVSVEPIEFPTAKTVKLQFSVQDNGIGITPEQMPLLFQSFSQVDSSMTRKYAGTGLGLAISKQLTELMGGHIWLKSEFGKGSTFYFTAIFALPEALVLDPIGDETQTIFG
jgi:PAS domain S-box-containing protein